MKKTVKRFIAEWWFPVLYAVVLVATVTAFYRDGFPYTHDGENHLVRFANYLAALREGQWPPRFAPYVQSGFGFPVFHYNYPLGNILAIPFLVIDMSPPQAFAWIVRLSLVVGSVAVWWIVQRTFGKIAAFLGTWVYVFSSYLVMALRVRGNIGEVLEYTLVPFVVALWLAIKPKSPIWHKAVLSVVIAAFLLAHNVLAVLIAPLLALWSGWRWRTCLRDWILIWLGAAGLVSWFWLPAVLELNLVVLTDDSLANEAVKHVLGWSQIWIEPLHFGFSLPGAVDTIGMGLGWDPLLTAFFAFIFGLKYLVKNREYAFGQEMAVAVLFTVTVFLSSVSSSFVWSSIPALSIIQFPWRWLFIVSLLIPLLVSWVYTRWPRWWQRALYALLVLILSWSWVRNVRIADRLHYISEYYLSAPHSTTTRNENRPRTLPSMQLDNWVPQPVIATGEGELVRVEAWLGSRRSYVVKANTDIIVTESTVYFPGWETEVDGQPVEQIFTEETRGLVAYRLPARSEPYQVASRFGQRTPIRLVSELVSLLTASSMVGWVVWDEVQKRKKS